MKEENNTRWIKWTFGEASMKTLSKVLQKVVGQAGTSFGHSIVATAVVGLFQTIGAYGRLKANRKSVWDDSLANIFGSMAFGLFATLATVIAFFVFTLGGDVGVNTFIITLSIIPGALIDWAIFRHPLGLRNWLGVLIGIFAGYTILEMPSLREVLELPLWVWLSFSLAMIVAINQGITQKVKTVDPMVKNFWGGLTTLVLSALVATNIMEDIISPECDWGKLVGTSAMIGVIVIFMWAFNVMAYKGGAKIAIKKLVMNGLYLTMAMTLGVILFGEPLTIYKVMGVVLYLIAFIFMDDASWRFFSRRI